MRIAITRPEDDAAALRAELEYLGHEVLSVPLLTIARRDSFTIPDRPWQAIAVTSANGVRMLGSAPHLQPFRMLTVGPQSLQAARHAGFVRAEAHGGDVEGLARHMRETLDPGDGPILYLSGADTAGDLAAQLAAANFECVRVVLYDAVPGKSLGRVADALRAHAVDAVLLYSPRTARVWMSLVAAEGLMAKAARPHYLCLSRNVAAVLPEVWTRHIAAAPNEAAMLGLLELIRRTL